MSITVDTKDYPHSGTPSDTREITVAHSPDSDDAFMFYGLATNKVRVPRLRFTHTLCDIETLNQKAMDGVFDVTAISFHAYPYIQDKYAIMPSGGSVGEGYGPMVVASRLMSLDEVKGIKIAVPGTMTTAYLALKLFAPEIVTEVVPFDDIIPRVLDPQMADRFVGMYVNERTLDYGRDGREAIGKLLDLGYEKGIIPQKPAVEFVGDAAVASAP